MIDFTDLEMNEATLKPIQKRDLTKYPLASMYYQYMLKKAERTRKDLIEVSKKIEGQYENVFYKIPSLKGFDRTIEKINNDYHGDFKKMLDIVRGSIICADLETLRAAILSFQKEVEIVSVKNRINHPTSSGYRDFIVTFYNPKEEFYGEMQFHLIHIIKAKSVAHKYYEKIRSIEGKASLEQRELTEAERLEVKSFNLLSKETYEKALNSYLAGESCDPSFLQKKN